MGIGSLYHTFKNALMVGSFFHLFFRTDLGLNALVIIGLHGTLELMTLVLNCMAGMILGLRTLFPGTLSRAQAFRKGLSESARIFIGTVPFIFIAAFIESYITRFGVSGLDHRDSLLSALLILLFVLSWIILVGYFFIYSRRVALSVNNHPKAPW